MMELILHTALIFVAAFEVTAGFISEWRGDKIKQFEHFQKAILLVLIAKMQKGLRKAATKLEKVIEGLKEENEEKAETAMAEYILQLIKVQSI